GAAQSDCCRAFGGLGARLWRSCVPSSRRWFVGPSALERASRSIALAGSIQTAQTAARRSCGTEGARQTDADAALAPQRATHFPRPQAKSEALLTRGSHFSGKCSTSTRS